MFRHIVLYQVKDRASAEEMKRRFESMPAHIPEIRALQTGLDVLHSERSFDICLETTFDSIEDYRTYKDSAYHTDYVASYVHSVVIKAVSVDYEF